MEILIKKFGRHLGLCGGLVAGVCLTPFVYANDPDPQALSFQGLQATGNNLGYEPSVNVSQRLRSQTSTLTVKSERDTQNVWVVEQEPTTEAAGVEAQFSVESVTSDYRVVVYTSHYSQLSGPLNYGANENGEKWFQISGLLTPLVDLYSVDLKINVFGSFSSVVTPFGAGAPALTSLYFGEGSSNIGSLPMNIQTRYDDGFNSYLGEADYSLYGLRAGESRSFSAIAYAPNDVSVIAFYLDWQTYTSRVVNEYSTTRELSRTYLGARSIAPIPEPETYALVLVGLGVVGCLARRRRI